MFVCRSGLRSKPLGVVQGFVRGYTTEALGNNNANLPSVAVGDFDSDFVEPATNGARLSQSPSHSRKRP